ncbi:VanZ family protein [Feifania hominis]|uniref:VanZ family protein n=1 Tax=Feifania hominis TaxID=2763660 RepID=A0A926HQU9_9FIRM|nr:VanZ family protein [Feifania hominis]MBC8536732.1 VanZ family protein [Feifania hominis]
MLVTSKKVRAAALVLTLCWMAVLFAFSAQNGTASSGTSRGAIVAVLRALPWFGSLPEAQIVSIAAAIGAVVRKCAHFAGYLLLGVFVAPAAASWSRRWQSCAGLSLGVCALYAVSDELHQYFVPGRSCELRDVLIDTAGAAVGVGLVLTVILLRRKKESSRSA